jgi:tetratricopeptide (TPR) repeat protein
LWRSLRKSLPQRDWISLGRPCLDDGSTGPCRNGYLCITGLGPGTRHHRLDKVAILRIELRAVVRDASGATDEAITLLREAARIEDATPAEFGPPDVVKPVHELLGEMLMKKGRAHEAEQAFERSLELAPRRSLSLLGLARAATAAGDRVAAAGAYAELASVWRHADPEVPGLAEVRQSGGVGATK